MRCTEMQGKLVEYLDGRAKPADRHAVEEHLSICVSCRSRVEEFRALWSALDGLPAISPSPAFDASLRTRIAAEPARRSFWSLLPSPRLAFAVTSLIAISVWMSAGRPAIPGPTMVGQTAAPGQISADSDFGMIRDLPVLENYDVVSKFDALSELPGAATSSDGERTKETR